MAKEQIEPGPEDLQPNAVNAPAEGDGSVVLRTRGLVGEYRHGLDGVRPVTRRPYKYSKTDADKIMKIPGASDNVVEVKE